MKIYHRRELRLLAGLLGIVLLCGCALLSPPCRLVTAQSLQKQTEVPRITVNDNRFPLKVTRAKGGVKISIAGDHQADPKTFRVWCEALGEHCAPQITCKLNGKPYPLALDTGAPFEFVVTDIHAIENKLPVFLGSKKYFGHDEAGRPIEEGYTYAAELRIGAERWTNLPGHYLGMHERYGDLPDKQMFAGVPLLVQHRYVLFDCIRHEVEFSLDKDFQPPAGEHWAQYPLSVEEDRVLIRLPIAGREEQALLDTGCYEMHWPAARWATLRQRLGQKVRLTNARKSFIGHGRQLGCQTGLIPTLQIGGNTLRKVRVNVYPDARGTGSGSPGGYHLWGWNAFMTRRWRSTFFKNQLILGEDPSPLQILILILRASCKSRKIEQFLWGKEGFKK